jgi:hypothetical protein
VTLSSDTQSPSAAEPTTSKGPELEKRYLSSREAAERIKKAGLRGGSRPTVIRWSDLGFLPHYKTPAGGYRNYRVEVIDLYIRECQQGQTDMKQLKERLFALHDQLAERDGLASEQQQAEAEATN